MRHRHHNRFGMSEQQFRVFRLICDGKTQIEIADVLGVSRYRVRAIVRTLCARFDAYDMGELPDAVAASQRPAQPRREEDDDDGRIRVDDNPVPV